MTKTGDNIMAALDVLETAGWCRGQLKNHEGHYCAVGAVNKVCYGHAIWWHDYTEECAEAPELQALAAHIPGDFKVTRFSSWDDCAYYNNSRESFAEIKEWFLKTALDEGISLE